MMKGATMKRTILILSSVLLLGLGSVSIGFADGPKVVNEAIVGSTPNIMIRSVISGAAPWVVKNGRARLDPSGHLKIKVKGLLIAAGALANGEAVPAPIIGTVATVTTVHAALTCGGPGGGVPFTITPTDGVPIGPNGDFEIDANLALPVVCSQPIILIRIGTPEEPGPWIASTTLPE
jgi:hypothetical protein